VLYCHAIYSGIAIYSLVIMCMSVIKPITFTIPWYIIFDGTRLLACKFYCLISSKVVLSSNFKMNKSYPIGFLHMKYLRTVPNKLYLYDRTKQSCCGKKSQCRNNNCSIAFCASTSSYYIVIPKVPQIFVIYNYFRLFRYRC
jgi:hypothetical protein